MGSASGNFAVRGSLYSSQQGRRVFGKSLLIGLGSGLLFFALSMGGLLLLTSHAQIFLDYTHIFVAIGMIFLPLLLLGLLIGMGTRYFQYSRMASGFQTRMDQLARRVKQREDLLRLVTDHQSGSVMIFDRSNNYWFLNQKCADGLGNTVPEIIGKTPGAVMPELRGKIFEERLVQARASEYPIECVDKIQDKRGITHFIQARYQKISPFAELMDGVLVNEEDITSLVVERERRENMLRQVIETLVAVVDRRDPYASGHSARVGKLARAMANEMALDSRQVDAAEIAGSLMNFGKVLVSRSVLTKATPLTAEELQKVRESILTSADILSIIGFEGPVVPTLRQVLERYDGSGAPSGLRGESILLTARIVTVANAFVAMVSPRAHRDGMGFKEALRRIQDEAGKMYDKRVVLTLANFIENSPNKLDWLKVNKQA